MAVDSRAGRSGRDGTGDEPDVIEAVERAMAALEAHPDAAVREATAILLQGIDAVHRAGLTHLVHAIHGMAGEAFVHRLTADPAIRLLLMSYGLVAVDRRIQAEEAVDMVRGHLHGHGIDVEIVEVVGGVVYVRLHVSPRQDGADRAAAARRDIEAALQSGFIGFQELVVRDRDPARVSATPIVPIEALRRARKPVYHEALPLADVPPGALKAVSANGVPVLLANLDGEIHALRNRCGESPLPLEFGELAGSELRCPWHGCRYDVRTGRRLDGEGGRIQTFPTSVHDGRIRIAADVEPAGR